MKRSNSTAFILVLILVLSNLSAFAQTRIRFPRGSTSTSVSGRIGGGGGRRHVLAASYGQYLSANVSSRNGCVTFSNGATSMSYTTRSGYNRLYLNNGCPGSTSYTLTVSIN